MGTRHRLGLLAAAVVVALSVSGRLEAAAVPTVIGTAQTSVRSSGQAARSTEAVRYDDTSLVLLASYGVVDGALSGDRDTARDTALWNLVGSTLPDGALGTIRQLNIVTDGHDGTLAMVHRSTVDPAAWVLSIDPAESRSVLVSTVVHEYGHMLTLGPADLTSRAASSGRCDGVRIKIGCAKIGSALAEWHNEFWAGVDEPADYDSRRFVSDYAASSVHEDLAESFMAWTLDEVVRPTSFINERFTFFAHRREFAAARDAIRAKLAR